MTDNERYKKTVEELSSNSPASCFRAAWNEQQKVIDKLRQQKLIWHNGAEERPEKDKFIVYCRRGFPLNTMHSYDEETDDLSGFYWAYIKDIMEVCPLPAKEIL